MPLLITGRLGDKFGPKTMYQLGLAVFTAASLWCGLSSSIGELIAAHGRPVTISSMPAFWPRAASLDCISPMLDLSDS